MEGSLLQSRIQRKARQLRGAVWPGERLYAADGGGRAHPAYRQRRERGDRGDRKRNQGGKDTRESFFGSFRRAEDSLAHGDRPVAFLNLGEVRERLARDSRRERSIEREPRRERREDAPARRGAARPCPSWSVGSVRQIFSGCRHQFQSRQQGEFEDRRDRSGTDSGKSIRSGLGSAFELASTVLRNVIG